MTNSVPASGPAQVQGDRRFGNLAADLAKPQRGLVWELAAEFQDLSACTVQRFGPDTDPADTGPMLHLRASSGRELAIGRTGHRWLLVAPPGSHLRVDRTLSRDSALNAAMDGAKTCLLADNTLRDLTVINGRDALQPVFLRTAPGGMVRLVEGVAALRSQGRNEPLPAAVSYFLAFGHLPRSGTMLRDVWVVQPGEVLRIPFSEAGGLSDPQHPEWLQRSATGHEAGGDALHAFLGRVLAAEVAGQRVAVVCARGSPAAQSLVEASRAAGAADVTEARLTNLPVSLSQLQSVTIALSGLPFCDPNLMLDAALALGAAENADIVLLPWGGELVLPSRPEFARAISNLASATGDQLSLQSIDGGFLRSGGFMRDAFFEEIAVFGDQERFRVMGPSLFIEGFRSMADEFGDGLEGVPLHEMSRAAARLDPSAGPGRGATALLASLRAMSGGRMLAPYLDPAAPSLRQSIVEEPTRAVFLRSFDISPDRLGTTLSPHAKVFTLGLVARNPRIIALLKQGDRGSTKQRAQAFALLALEKWLRVVDAAMGGNAHGFPSG